MPYWRLSTWYLFFFASIGVLLPYWSLYLDYLGFSAAEIGELMAVLMATKIVSPNIWGWIADHTGKRLRIVRIGSFLSVVAFVGVFFGSSYWWLMAVMVGFSFFWNASLPQFEVTTLNHLGRDTHRYSHIRLWGSVGFIAAAIGLGPLLDQQGMGLLPWYVLLLMVCIWLISVIVPEDQNPAYKEDQVSFVDVLKRPYVLALLTVCFLMQASHGPYYTFYSLYLEGFGYSRSVIGQLWALGVLAEVGAFILLHRVSQRYSLKSVLLLSLLLTIVRWLLIGLFPQYFIVLLLGQLLHAASFGVFHVVAIQLIHKHFVGRIQGRGQALYSSMSFGAGGAIGSLYSGYLWGEMGSTATYMVASMLSLIAFIIAWIGLRE